MRGLFACLAVWGMAVGVAGGVAAESLRYEPAVVRLAGFLSVEKHFGPPGYGEDPKHDSVEEALILVLDGWAEVQGDPKGGGNTESFSDVQRIQVVILDQDNRMLWRMIGQHVALEGTLFQAVTGHHHTRVLMTVKSFRPDPVVERANPALDP